MARKIEVLFTDDLDGSEASETISFTLDGVSYEIDLSSSNAAKFRTDLARYIERARPVSQAAGPRRARPPAVRPEGSGSGSDAGNRAGRGSLSPPQAGSVCSIEPGPDFGDNNEPRPPDRKPHER
jgi:hypothetical protein